MPHLQDTSQTLLGAVEKTIASLGDVTDADAGAIQLARYYARQIDETDEPKIRSWLLWHLGPELLRALESLGATPASRSKLKGGKPGDAPVSQLAKLRAARHA